MKIIILLMLLAITQTAFGNSEVDRYGVLPKIQQMSISPDGEKVAFRSVDLEQDIVSIIDLTSGTSKGNIDVSSVKPRDVNFIGNENILLRVSAQKSIPGFRREFELSTALTYNIDKKKYSQLLVPGKDSVYAAQPTLDKVIGLSSDGKSAYMPAFSGEPTYSMGQQISPPMSLFRMRLDGSGRPRIHQRGRGHATDYFIADDGDVLAIEAFDESNNKHTISAYHGKKLVEIFSEDTPYAIKNFLGVSLNEQHLFMLSYDSASNRSAIYSLSLNDGEIEGPLYNRDNADITGHIIDEQRKVLGVRYSGFNPSYKFLDSDLDQRVQAILADFPQESVWIDEISTDRQHVLIRVEGSQSAGKYYLYSKGKQTVLITSQRPTILDDQIHPVTSVAFAARDGLEIPTLITVPKGRIDSLENLPAIMMPHGGPESSDHIGFNYLAQALAEQGYLVIQPQFRGSVGFGEKHQAAGYGEWGRKALYDLSDALNFFAKQDIIDPTRVCIVGASYGGYSALAGGAFTPDLYKCVVSINGVGNLEDLLNRERTEQGRSSSSLAFWEAQILGFDGKDMDVAKQRSPELAASEFKAPVLLIHSEKDESVHPRQSITMYRALQKADKKVEKIELEGEDHYLSHGETRLKALRAIVEFVNKNI